MSDGSNRNSGSAGGVSFCGLLTIVFIVLKLTHVIEWSWLWVLSPMWIPAIVIIAIFVITVGIHIIASIF